MKLTFTRLLAGAWLASLLGLSLLAHIAISQERPAPSGCPEGYPPLIDYPLPQGVGGYHLEAR